MIRVLHVLPKFDVTTSVLQNMTQYELRFGVYNVPIPEPHRWRLIDTHFCSSCSSCCTITVKTDSRQRCLCNSITTVVVNGTPLDMLLHMGAMTSNLLLI